MVKQGFYMVRCAVVVTATFCFLGLPTAHAADTVATVNGVVITTDQVDAAFKRTSYADKQLPSEQRDRYRQHILTLLIDDLLVNQFLAEQNIAADPAKVDSHVDELKRQLAAKGKTMDEFLADMKVTEAEMRTDITNIYRWLAYLETQVTEKTLQKYFEANRAAFDGSEVRASHILAKVAPGAAEEERSQAKNRLTQIRAQLAAGTSFSEAAKAYSDCPSKTQGGDLGLFPRKGVMSEAFSASAFDLKQGELSEIVETEFGYHLIVVTERKAGKPVTFEQVAEDVKDSYAEDARFAVIDRMRQKSQIEMFPANLVSQKPATEARPVSER